VTLKNKRRYEDKKLEKGSKKMKKVSFILLTFFMVLILTSVAFSQRQTGSIRGMVYDEDGQPLPGVTISITSPAMQGNLTFVTTEEGAYRFPSCPPGEYELRAEISGFQIVTRPGIRVRVGMVVGVDIQMKMATLEKEVIVKAASPMVDTQSSTFSITATPDFIKSIPMRRNVLDIYQSAPSAVGEGELQDYRKSASIHGGALTETKFTLDGVDLVDPQRGYIGIADVNFDAIDEVEILEGGLPADVGQAGAGTINVVTKSGGNKLSAGIMLWGTTKAFSQNIIPEAQLKAAQLATPIFYNYKYDIGLNIGGPIIKDKLWFFISPRYTSRSKKTFFVPFTDPQGIYHPAYDFQRRDLALLGKFTAQIAKKLKWMGMYQYCWYKEEPDVWAIEDKYTPLESQVIVEDRAHATSQIFTYIIDQNTYTEFSLGYINRPMYDPPSDKWEGPVDRPSYYDRATEYYWGSFSSTGEKYTRISYDFSASFTRFQDNFWGMDHELKAGVEYNRGNVKTDHWRVNPYNLYWYNGTPWYFGDSVPYKGYFEILTSARHVGDAPSKNGVWRWSAFLQDSLNIGKRLALKLGLRYDESHGFIKATYLTGWADTWSNGLANVLLPEMYPTQNLNSPDVDNIIKYNILAPRIGLTYDLFGDGKTALTTSFSRYGEILVTWGIEDMEFFPRYSIGFTWYDDNHNGNFDLSPTDRYIIGNYTPYIKDPDVFRNQVDPNLKTPYTDEWMARISHELIKDFSISLNFTYREARNLVGVRNLTNPREGDMWLPYTVTDPGPDGSFSTGDDQQLTVYGLKGTAKPNVLQKQNIDEARRKYWGVDLIFFKRMSNNWQFNGSITYSKTYGNYPNEYGSIRGATNWWNPNQDVNRWGRLAFDRPLMIKLMATVALPFGINASAYYRYFTGSPWNRTMTVYFPETINGFKLASPSVTVKAEPLGTRTNIPVNNMDLRIEKEFPLGRGRLGIWFEVFNLFGNYSFSFYQDSGGYLYPDGTFQRFSRYGQVIAAEGLRSVNFALRYNF
jgi:hypothetical protein